MTMTGKACVLVVDDEVGVRTAVARGLRAEGMDVVTAGDGPGGLREASSDGVDVIVLDVGLPGLSGYEVVARLRRAGMDTPVLLISGNSGESEQATGFNLGADGYLVKPLSLLVLVAQVKALLRRGDPAPIPGPHQLRLGDLVVDRVAKTASWKGCVVGLSPREYALLYALITCPGTVVSKPQLRALVWGGQDAVTPNAVEVYIGYLRRKLERIGAVEVVRTVHVRGYQVQAAGEDWSVSTDLVKVALRGTGGARPDHHQGLVVRA